MLRLVFAFLLVLFGTGAIPAHAAMTCVATPAQLAATLATAAENGQHDDIRLRRGTYQALQPGQFEYITNVDEPFDLVVSGDWNSNCTQRGDNPFSTIVDGNGVSRGMKLLANSVDADLEVRLLTFLNGVAPSQGDTSGGGLSIGVTALSQSSVIRVERNVFLFNQASIDGGLGASGGAFQQVVNNLFVANTAQRTSAVGMQCRHALGSDDHPGYGAFANNTIVDNEYLQPDAQTAYITCRAGAIVANNNFDGNSGSFDLVFHRGIDDTGPFTLRNNNIHGHTPADVDEDNIDVVPEYEDGFLSFTPARSSPLVDAGTEPAGALALWYLTDFDLNARPREIGPHVDIGAYENERIFADGFDPAGLFGLSDPRVVE